MGYSRIKINERYGDIIVMGRVGTSSHGDILFQCRCKCGTEFTRKSSSITYSIKRGYKPKCTDCHYNDLRNKC